MWGGNQGKMTNAPDVLLNADLSTFLAGKEEEV